MLALALALCSSLAWGFADFIAGLKSRTLPVLTVMLVAVSTGLVLAAAIVAVRGADLPGARHVALAALSAVLGSVGLAAFYRGLAIGAMSVVAPIAATGAVVPVAFGLASGERPRVIQLAGVVLAVAGVVLAARESGPEPVPTVEEDGAPAALAERARPGRRIAAGAPLALVAALGLGSFLVAIGAASRGDVGWAILTNRGVSLVLLLLAALAVRPRPPAGIPDAAPAVAVGLLETVANTLVAVATTLGLVSLVGVLASLFPVVTVALARLVLGERIAPVQRLGTVGALGGVVLIAAGTAPP